MASTRKNKKNTYLKAQTMQATNMWQCKWYGQTGCLYPNIIYSYTLNVSLIVGWTSMYSYLYKSQLLWFMKGESYCEVSTSHQRQLDAHRAWMGSKSGGPFTITYVNKGYGLRLGNMYNPLLIQRCGHDGQKRKTLQKKLLKKTACLAWSQTHDMCLKGAK